MLGLNNQSGPPTVRIRINKGARAEVYVSKLRDYLKCRVWIILRRSYCLLAVIYELDVIQADIDDLPWVNQNGWRHNVPLCLGDEAVLNWNLLDADHLKLVVHYFRLIRTNADGRRVLCCQIFQDDLFDRDLSWGLHIIDKEQRSRNIVRQGWLLCCGATNAYCA